MITIPTYSEIYTSVINDLKNKLGITSIIGKSVLPAFAAVYAAKFKIMYILASVVEKNSYPDTSDEENLRRAGRIVLGRDINPAIAGEYTLDVVGEVGAEIPINTTYVDSRGNLFIVDTLFTFTGTTGQITVRALTAGSESALAQNDTLQLTSKLVNVDSFGTIYSVDVIPASAEELEEYRQNVIQAYQLQPQGGSRADYRIWTEGVSGIREVYPFVKTGYAGEINLYIEAFPNDSTPVGSGIPSTAQKNAVQAAIEPDKIPMTVKTIHYLPINPLDVDVIITDLSDSSKLPTIENSIRNYLYNIRPYVAGADVSSDSNKGRMYASEVEGLIIATGVTFTDVEVQVDSTPISTYEFIENNIPYLQPVTEV